MSVICSIVVTEKSHMRQLRIILQSLLYSLLLAYSFVSYIKALKMSAYVSDTSKTSVPLVRLTSKASLNAEFIAGILKCHLKLFSVFIGNNLSSLCEFIRFLKRSIIFLSVTLYIKLSRRMPLLPKITVQIGKYRSDKHFV